MKKKSLPLDIVKLGEDNSYHLFVRGKINGVEYDLLIDTGASHTIFDASLFPKKPAEEGDPHIQSSGINAGALSCLFGHIEKFKLGKMKRKNWTVIMIDLTHVNEMYKKFSDKHVAGLIGSDFLLKHKAIIDYKKRRIVFKNIAKK